MINYETYLLKIFKSKIIWFNNDAFLNLKEFSFITLRQSVYMQIPQKYIITQQVFTTVCINLLQSVDEIWAKFDKKSTKYEIHRAEKFKDDIEIIYTKRIPDLIEFLKYGEEYYSRKYNKKKQLKLDDILRKKNYLLIKALYRGEFVCGNVYIYDESRVRLNYSFSRYLENEYFKSISTYLTRYLHWISILYFKNQGKSLYDFGGITQDRSAATYGITKFKLSFGGDLKEEYDYTISKYGYIINIFVQNRFFRSLLGRLSFVKKMLYG